MVEVVVTIAAAIGRAKLLSNCHHQRTQLTVSKAVENSTKQSIILMLLFQETAHNNKTDDTE